MPIEFHLDAGIAELRARFRAEGFAVPDVYAGIVSQVCGRQTTPEAIQAEWDRHAVNYIRHGGREPPTFAAIDLTYRKALGSGFMPEALHRRIDEQKHAEANALLPEWPGRIERKTQLRDFAEAFAATRGFSVVRKATSGVGRVLRKAASREDGCAGDIAIDVGGRFGAVWTSNQTSFHLRDSKGLGAGTPHLSAITRGVEYYGSAHPSYEVLAANRHQDPRSPEVVSSLIKLGVMAEIVFFDILLDLVSVRQTSA